MVSFSHTIAFRDDDTFRPLDRPTHIGLQLRASHCAISMNGIDFPVIVKKHAKVVDVTLHVVVCPRSLDVLCCVALQAFSVDVGEHVELPVGITNARCPDALTVNLLVILQRESLVVEVKAVEAVRDVLPVHQVF